MIITKAALSRRTFLRGMGVTLALPYLDAMTPALTARTPTVPRLGFFYVGNATSRPHWNPIGDERNFEYNRIMKPVEPFRDDIVLLTGLSNLQAEPNGEGGGVHARCSGAWLNGARPKRSEADPETGITIDQMAAPILSRDSQLLSLELALEPSYLVGNCDQGYSCAYFSTTSWKTPTTPMPMENDPAAVFDRLFGEGGSPEARQWEFQQTRSILDHIPEQIAGLRHRLGVQDNTTLTEYLEGVRGVERRIQLAQQQNGESPLPNMIDRPAGIPESFEEHATIMLELLALAYQADITRVASFQFCREFSSRAYSELGLTETHHTLSHHNDDPEKEAAQAKINAFHVQLYAKFLERLRNTPEGDGSMLDNSLLMYGAGMGDGDTHSPIDLPTILVGGASGRLKGGRLLQYPTTTPMANLLVSILGLVDVPVEAVGNSTGSLPLVGLA